jgi:hypothetical protein
MSNNVGQITSMRCDSLFIKGKQVINKNRELSVRRANLKTANITNLETVYPITTLVSNPGSFFRCQFNYNSRFSFSDRFSDISILAKWVMDPNTIAMHFNNGDINIPYLVTIDRLFTWINTFDNLNHYDVSNIENIIGDIVLPTGGSIDGITNLSFPSLKHILPNEYNDESIKMVVGPYPDLQSLSFPHLEFTSTIIDMRDMTVLTSLSFPLLQRSDIILQNLSMLSTISFPSLEIVPFELTIRDEIHDAAVTTIDFPALTTMYSNEDDDHYSYFSIYSLSGLGFPNLTTINLPLLRILSYFYIIAPALTSINLPSLESIGIFEFIKCNLLTTVTFPKLIRHHGTTTGYDFIIVTDGCPLLANITLPTSLLEVKGNINITSAALTQASVDNILTRMAALNGTNGTTSYNNKTIVLTGTSASPSAIGLAAKSILEARGCTITVN